MVNSELAIPKPPLVDDKKSVLRLIAASLEAGEKPVLTEALGRVVHYLAEFVLSAKYGSEYFGRSPASLPIHAEKGYWWCALSDEVVVTFDGYSLNDDDTDDRDVESFVVSLGIGDDNLRPSFFVSLVDCLGPVVTVDWPYLAEKYELDIEEQLKGAGLSRRQFETWLKKSYKKWKQEAPLFTGGTA